MSLRNINLRVLVGTLLIVLGATCAEAKGREDFDDSVCNPLAAGIYVRPDDSPFASSLLGRWVEIYPRSEDGYVKTEVNIPWGSKHNIYRLRFDCRQDPYHAIVVDNGLVQYDIGKNPYFSVNRSDRLRIYTKIKVPGFSGTYEFQKER